MFKILMLKSPEKNKNSIITAIILLKYYHFIANSSIIKHVFKMSIAT